MGCLEELSKLVTRIENICRDNGIECSIVAYKEDKKEKYTKVIFDCAY